ncbi:hypothetical protein KSS94_06500 [Pseudomonas fakonensis]|uniref:Dermonecrotic toxin N-terminal domain-containing protein n=1 Tax=Pseudomonas fakonensis TaxID=2842355 RepID=A0ABX8N8W9_9PSED|nr:DUF6543 domain-containing protein [Pseudomonas fakonensis]QXH52776.1 hypothetical protein KSS94_06500 [Pseudomonas fakonensis]
MSALQDKFQRNYDTIEQAEPFVRLVDEFIRDFPDPYRLANEHARRIVRQRVGKALDPRFFWWHQFSTTVSSPRTFTGWQHSGPPEKSMTLTQLVVQRFDLRFQEATDDLNLYGGFYRDGPQAPAFDERNEQRLLGSDVQNDLWALNFGATYRAEVERFWQGSGGHFKVLAKLNLLGQAFGALQAGRIDAAELALVRQMSCATASPLTLAQLQQNASDAPLEVSRYDIGHGQRPWLYSLAAANGRVLLYLPWSDQAFRSFASEQQLAGWVRKQLQDPTQLEAFVQAAQGDQADQAQGLLIRGALNSIGGSRSSEAAEVLLGYMRRRLSGDFFVYLAEQAEAEMRSHAAAILDNAALRKALWSGYLSAFLGVFGSFAPLGWPMVLLLLGAGVSRVALDVDAALSAADVNARQQALREAIIDSLGAAFSLVDLGFRSNFAMLGYQPPAHELNTSLAGWGVHAAPSAQLDGLESNQLVPVEPIGAGVARGVEVRADGSCRISLEGLSYRVRYSSDLSSWLIVSEDNPYAFAPLRPVRLNAAGHWELLERPRLAAGAPQDVEGMASQPSPFWDQYMAADQNSSAALSARARIRQKKLLRGLPVLPRDQLPEADEDGIYCIKVGGVPVYSYLHEGDGFHNELVEYFTDEDSQVNRVFRYGTYDHDDVDSYIAKLADSLEQLPRNNVVTLYRGGNAARGTSGAPYRDGRLKVGDTLINTDLTSFTENPYIVPEFAARVAVTSDLPWLFDDTSVVFELPAGQYSSGTPISAFSMYWEEAETLFLPGQYFRIEKLEQLYGPGYRFIHVQLKQIAQPASGPLHDLRTGALFDRAVMAQRVRTPALVQRFFPEQGGAASTPA